MQIGFIGLGTMGGAASLNLIRGGHQLTVCDLNRERAVEHEKLGAIWAEMPCDAAEGADIVFTMVFGPKQIENVVHGANGLLSALGPGQIWVDMTTNHPEVAGNLRMTFRELGQRLLMRL